MAPFALLLALIWSCAVAIIIGGTQKGRWIASISTWLTVVVGVGGDLLILLVLADELGRVLWWHVLAVFAVSGIPVSAQNIDKFHAYFMELMDAAAHKTGE